MAGEGLFGELPEQAKPQTDTAPSMIADRNAVSFRFLWLQEINHLLLSLQDLEWIVRQKRQLLALHVSATPTQHAPDIDIQIDARVATGKIANLPHAPIVPPDVHATTTAADRFFERRLRMITRAFGSPNTPRTLVCGRKPGKALLDSSLAPPWLEIHALVWHRRAASSASECALKALECCQPAACSQSGTTYKSSYLCDEPA